MENDYEKELKIINVYLDHTIEDRNNIRIPSNVKFAISILSRKMDFHYAKIIKNYISELKIDKVDVPSNVVNAVDALCSKTFNI